MTPEELQARFAARFPKADKAKCEVKGWPTMRLPSAADVPPVVRWLKDELGYGYLEMLTAVDWLGPADDGGLVRDPNPHACGGKTPLPEPSKKTPGVDYRDAIELVYCLANFDERCKVFLKADVPRSGARVPSLTGLFKGADWQEREVFDLFGVEFEGHPNLKKILTPEFLKGNPLRKDYVHQKDRFD
jgi:NADH:ubiquinone oxidoreductase subunit C